MEQNQPPQDSEDEKVEAFKQELIKVCEKHKMNVVPVIEPLGPRLMYVSSDAGTEHSEK